MTIPPDVRQWLIDQLHLKTDNMHIQNLGQATIGLHLYTTDGKGGWTEAFLAELAVGDHRWIGLKALSQLLVLGTTRPAGETVLVVRALEQMKGKVPAWRIDNVHTSWPIQAMACAPEDGFSYTGAYTLLTSGAIKPQTHEHHFLSTGKTEPIDGHWEYWFDSPLINPEVLPY